MRFRWRKAAGLAALLAGLAKSVTAGTMQDRILPDNRTWSITFEDHLADLGRAPTGSRSLDDKSMDVDAAGVHASTGFRLQRDVEDFDDNADANDIDDRLGSPIADVRVDERRRGFAGASRS